MRSRGASLRVGVVVIVTAAFLALAGAAFGYHRADRAEFRAVARALAHHPQECASDHNPRVRRVIISTPDRRYAGATCGVFGHFFVIMRRPDDHSEHWVVDFPIGDNPPECSQVVRHVPRAVIHDFRIGGFRGTRAVKYC